MDGPRQHGEVVVKLLLELRQVPHIVHPLVEAAGELRRDRLHRNFLVGDHQQDEKQLGGRLRGHGVAGAAQASPCKSLLASAQKDIEAARPRQRDAKREARMRTRELPGPDGV